MVDGAVGLAEEGGLLVVFQLLRPPVPRLHENQRVEDDRIELYGQQTIGETDAAACLLHAFEARILTTRSVPQVIAEWRAPKLDEFQPRTSYSLFNAITAALKERHHANLARFAALTMRVYRLLDRMPAEALAV